MGPGPAVTGVVSVPQPVPDQELTGLPSDVLIICTPGKADGINLATAVATFEALNEYCGGVPVPWAGAIVQRASTNPGVQAGGGGALFTFSVASANSPVSRSSTNRLSETFAYVPSTGTVTLTLTEQVPLAAIVPSEKAMEEAPAAGEKMGAPQPAVAALGGLATTIAPGEAGKVSSKLIPLTAAALGLVMVKVKRETPPSLVGSGLNFLAMVRLDGSTMAAMRPPTE